MPAVPQVVPDENALLDEQRPVHVGRGIARRRRQGDEQSRADAGEAAREQHFTARGDESGDGGGHRARRSVHCIDSRPCAGWL